jgi:hypothetical protein
MLTTEERVCLRQKAIARQKKTHEPYELALLRESINQGYAYPSWTIDDLREYFSSPEDAPLLTPDDTVLDTYHYGLHRIPSGTEQFENTVVILSSFEMRKRGWIRINGITKEWDIPHNEGQEIDINALFAAEKE